jgi:hypothetical protein
MSYVALLGVLLLTLAVALLAWAYPRAPRRTVHRRR